MHSTEWNELVECLDCGATIASTDCAYAITDETFLCFSCAVRKGGVYDADHDRWTVAPNVSDEPDERRPHP